MSTTESEYIALSECVKEIKWTRALLVEFEVDLISTPSTVFEDSTGVLHWVSGERRAKHVKLRYHFAPKAVTEGHIVMQYCLLTF